MNVNQQVSAKGIVNLKEFKRYNKYHVRKREMTCFFLSLVLFFITFYVSMTGDFLSVIIFSILFSVITSILLTFVIKLINIRAAMKEYKSESKIKSEMIYIFNSEGIRLKTESSDALFRWEEIQRAIQKKEMFILYVTTIKAIVIPKRFFCTEEDIELFKGIVLENMDATKVKF